jgi:hypothetical protein
MIERRTKTRFYELMENDIVKTLHEKMYKLSYRIPKTTLFTHYQEELNESSLPVNDQIILFENFEKLYREWTNDEIFNSVNTINLKCSPTDKQSIDH